LHVIGVNSGYRCKQQPGAKAQKQILKQRRVGANCACAILVESLVDFIDMKIPDNKRKLLSDGQLHEGDLG
jgi:hypothetical protein